MKIIRFIVGLATVLIDYYVISNTDNPFVPLFVFFLNVPVFAFLIYRG